MTSLTLSLSIMQHKLFVGIFRTNVSGAIESFPKWMSVNQPVADRSQLTATQVHTVLKEKARQRFVYYIPIFIQ